MTVLPPTYTHTVSLFLILITTLKYKNIYTYILPTQKVSIFPSYWLFVHISVHSHSIFIWMYGPVGNADGLGSLDDRIKIWSQLAYMYVIYERVSHKWRCESVWIFKTSLFRRQRVNHYPVSSCWQMFVSKTRHTFLLCEDVMGFVFTFEWSTPFKFWEFNTRIWRRFH